VVVSVDGTEEKQELSAATLLDNGGSGSSSTSTTAPIVVLVFASSDLVDQPRYRELKKIATAVVVAVNSDSNSNSDNNSNSNSNSDSGTDSNSNSNSGSVSVSTSSGPDPLLLAQRVAGTLVRTLAEHGRQHNPQLLVEWPQIEAAERRLQQSEQPTAADVLSPSHHEPNKLLPWRHVAASNAISALCAGAGGLSLSQPLADTNLDSVAIPYSKPVRGHEA
jgi:hypothetical protein